MHIWKDKPLISRISNTFTLMIEVLQLCILLLLYFISTNRVHDLLTPSDASFIGLMVIILVGVGIILNIMNVIYNYAVLLVKYTKYLRERKR
jgi:ABC-type polysaccharide/polyol phosphate export permease